jgi:hypothetical protein
VGTNICGMFIVSQPIRNKVYRSARENVSGQTTNNKLKHQRFLKLTYYFKPEHEKVNLKMMIRFTEFLNQFLKRCMHIQFSMSGHGFLGCTVSVII